MSFGGQLFSARKKKGMSQEAVSEVLGVSRQTISKWELDETIPDIYQAKKLERLYDMSLDDLIDDSADIKEIQDMIDKISEKESERIDWNKVWSKKYPVLATYKERVSIDYYAAEIYKLLDHLEKTYGYHTLDSMLILKDILANVWKLRQKK